MVAALRSNRNMGHNIMIDKENEYRRLVDITIASQEQFVNALKTGCRRYDGHHYYSKQWKHDTWLLVLGLIETWDMVMKHA
ncbi:hypothetical protein LCGC14_2610840 [marine sediment metagenome]|uniref:Uncharacterized protein n=1 Tax=marine sediment metagenome TaxID=412755 RepID=A0A0F9A5Y1_9ZZZZ